MNIEIKRNTAANETTFAVIGAMDASGITTHGTMLDSLFGDCATNVVVDMDRVSLLDASGIGALVASFKRLHARGLEMRIVGTSGQPDRLLRRLKLDSVFALASAAPVVDEAPAVAPVPMLKAA
jgi:anti-anti-sigma factor